jgi:hypothetical protein
MSDPLTTANAEQLFQDAWKAGLIEATRTADLSVWYDTRKRFVGTMVLAATDRLKTGKVNWTSLVQGTLDAIRQRQVMIYTAGPEAAELKQLEWDGGLRSSDGDYLMIVDSNIGYSKGNPLLDQRASYKVKLDTAGNGHATLVLDYTHRGTKSNIVCSGVPIPYVETLTYEDMMHRCYYDYIRLIVPPGSELQGSIAHPVPGKYLLSRKPADGVAETLPGENGRTVFGQFFVVDYGKRLQAQFEYDLPTLVRDNGAFKQYSLLLQKQSGTDAMPVKVTLYLPPKAQLILAKPQPVSLPGDPLEFNLVLDTDRKVQVVYALAP